MKTASLLAALSVLLLAGFFAVADREDCDRYMGVTVASTQYSIYVKDKFEVNVYLPRSYNRHPERRYPVIYQLNGNYHGRTAAILTSSLHCRGRIPTEALVVSIGYHQDSWMDKRERDYIYVAQADPESLQITTSNATGGGLNFYNFLTKELVPYIDTNFRSQNDRYGRTLMGHSLAGYFVLFSFFRDHHDPRTQSPVFRNFIAAAPLVVNGWRYLSTIELIMAQKQKNAAQDFAQDFHKISGFDNVKIFTALSEQDETNPIHIYRAFTRQMRQRHYPGFTFKSAFYPNYTHIATAVPAFTEGLTFVFH